MTGFGSSKNTVMHVPLFHIDAFTSKIFGGNPAAVCPLERWPEDGLLRAIAAENNLSETAYFVAHGEDYALRWFTRRCEVNLCGHATLASGFVILSILEQKRESVRFETRSGALTVSRQGELLSMDFPALPTWTGPNPPAELASGLQSTRDPIAVRQVKDNYFLIYESEDAVRSITPNLAVLEKLHPFGVAITAPGKDSDYVSRYFAPSYGIPEDPVTGSIHCSLAPYWGERLGKKHLHARQVSDRGGEMWCELAGERVIIKGQAVLSLQGSMSI